MEYAHVSESASAAALSSYVANLFVDDFVDTKKQATLSDDLNLSESAACGRARDGNRTRDLHNAKSALDDLLNAENAKREATSRAGFTPDTCRPFSGGHYVFYLPPEGNPKTSGKRHLMYLSEANPYCPEKIK